MYYGSLIFDLVLDKKMINFKLSNALVNVGGTSTIGKIALEVCFKLFVNMGEWLGDSGNFLDYVF